MKYDFVSVEKDKWGYYPLSPGEIYKFTPVGYGFEYAYDDVYSKEFISVVLKYDNMTFKIFPGGKITGIHSKASKYNNPVLYTIRKLVVNK